MFDRLRARYFPYDLPGGVAARAVSYEMYQAVRPLLFNNLFPGWQTRPHLTLPEERAHKVGRLSRIFRRTHHEWFVFYQDEHPVGWSVGHMEDALTFRMNNSGLIPALRRQGIYTAFTRRLLDYLQHIGYERVSSYHHPNNRAVLAAKLKLGFNITGTWLSEDGGAVVKLTYFFYEDRRRTFETAFGLQPDFTQDSPD